jgi:hypothetical protein
MKSYFMGSRKVRNFKIKDKIGVKLAYPTYREGLTALVGALTDGA